MTAPATSLVQVGRRSERAEVERAVLAALDGLRHVAGGYLEALDYYAGEFAAGDMDQIRERLLGRAPAVLILTGDAEYDLKSMTRQRAVVELELLVFIASAHLRSREERVQGEGVADPGVDAIRVEVRDRLMGANLGLPGVHPLRLVREEHRALEEGFHVLEMTFLVRCAVDAAPPPGQPVRALKSVEHHSNLDDGSTANPVVVGVTP